MLSRIFRRLTPFIGLILLCLAIWVLHGKLAHYSLADVLSRLQKIPPARIAAAAAFTLAYYITLCGYDLIGLAYIGKSVTPVRLLITSFISFTLGHSIGMSTLTSGSVRLRMYSSKGLTGSEITKIIGMCTLTFWVGFMVMGSVVFLLRPVPLPYDFGGPFHTVMPVGAVLLVMLGIYIGVTLTHRTPVAILGLKFPPLSSRLLLAQITMGCADWLLASAVLYALLPAHPHFPYTAMLSVFLCAQLIGLASQVPAGIGVFETVVLFLLPAAFRPSDILGVLIVYRVLFYLIPFILATGTLGMYELRERRKRLRVINK